MIGRLRRDDRTPAAVHARVHDGAHLWLAVRDASGDPGALALLAPDGTALEVPTQAEDDLRVACVALPTGAAATSELRLVAGRGRRTTGVRLDDSRAPGPTLASPTTPDGRGRWEVGTDDDGAVVLRRVPVAARVDVRRFAVVDDAVEVHLDTLGREVASAVLVHEGVELARTPVEEGRLTVPVDVPVPAGVVATWEVDGVSVGRASNVLVRPHPAVVLPPLADAADGASLELRWLPDGRLGLQRAGG